MTDADAMRDHSYFDVLVAQASEDVAEGRLDQALERYRHASTLQPGNGQVHHNIGALLAKRAQWIDAERHLLQAERLQPGTATSSLALGHVYVGAGRIADAAAAFERALECAPDSLEAHCNLGITLQALGASARALPSLEYARARLPLAEGLFRAHFEALRAVDRPEDADRAFLGFECHASSSAWLAATGLQWARTTAHYEFEAKYLAMALGWDYQPIDLRWLADIIGIIQYFDVSRRQAAALYRRYNALMQARAGTRNHRISRVDGDSDRDEKLRIGYLSSDFRRHVMGDIMLQVFACHDHDRFAIFAYSLLPETMEDAWSNEYRQCCDAFVRLAPLTDADAAARIAGDRVDLLVDLTGHTPQARPGILLHKPAPVIVAHLGDHGTIGLDQVDYKLTDACADLPDAGEHQVEAPLIMHGCVMPFRRVAPVPASDAARATDGAKTKDVVFAAFAAVLKLSPRCLELWRRILDSVPSARLAISPFTHRARVETVSRLTSAGIGADRIIVIQPSADDAVNRARYRFVDVLLDTLPYTGGDSTVAALDMGVPVVTRSGERQAERMGLSILSHLGLNETVAESDHAYVDIACRLALDADWRKEVSARIRDRVVASGMGDFGRYTRNLEEAFLRALAAPRTAASRRTAADRKTPQ